MRSEDHQLRNPELQAQFREMVTVWVDSMTDPMSTAQAVSWLVDMVETEMEPLMQKRVAAIRRLWMDGHSLREIADQVGLSRARVHQIART